MKKTILLFVVFIALVSTTRASDSTHVTLTYPAGCVLGLQTVTIKSQLHNFIGLQIRRFGWQYKNNLNVYVTFKTTGIDSLVVTDSIANIPGNIGVYRLFVITEDRLGYPYWSTLACIDKCSVLATNIESFSAKLSGTRVNLNWQCANELEVSSFELQRSSNAMEFALISDISSGRGYYQFADNTVPKTQNVYYRIKFIEKNGNYTYSNIIRVTLNSKAFGLITIGPNPATSSITIIGDNLNKTTIQFIDMNGKIVLNQKFNNGIVDLSNLPKGMYVCKLIDKDGPAVKTERILKQ